MPCLRDSESPAPLALRTLLRVLTIIAQKGKTAIQRGKDSGASGAV